MPGIAMTNRRRLLLYLMASALALGAGVWLLWPRSAINADNFARIRVGMPLDEVETILGGPERDEAAGPVEPAGEPVAVAAANNVTRQSGSGGALESWMPRKWTSERLSIWLWLDLDHRVSLGHAVPVQRSSASLVDRVRRWLRL
jgi:hypothetical protein